MGFLRKPGLLMARCCVLLGALLLVGLIACGGEIAVSFPGCEECPERCLRDGNSNSGKCVTCLNDVQCQSDSSPTKKCVENKCVCGTDKDCPANRHCAGARGCVDCTEDSHCSGNTPICLDRICVACKPGTSEECAPEGSNVCTKGTRTCRTSGIWGKCENAVVCQEGERCYKGTCYAPCPDPAPCEKDDKICQSKAGEYPGKFANCVLNDKGCYEIDKNVQSCGAKEICDKGQCSPFSCPAAECKEGETRCVDDDNQQACGRNKDNCIVWLPSTSCQNGEKCRKDSIKKCSFCNPKETKECYDGDASTKGVGECKAGTQLCKEDGTAFSACVGQVLPQTDICDGKDNDCDGAVDEDFSNVGSDCEAGQGTCKNKGKVVCSADGKSAECNAVAGSPATKELCNGQDDDCDGQVDEDFPDLQKVCEDGVGECKGKGTYICSPDGSKVICDAKKGTPSKEVCDGKDNDCDGTADNGLTRQCFTGTTGCEKLTGTEFYRCKGSCNFGVQSCAGGSWTACAQEVLPSIEVCNGKDDDCDGQTDNGNPGGGVACKVPNTFALCADGQTACVNGTVACQQINLPKTEICDGKDNDCDGQIDNSIPQNNYYPDDDKDGFGNKASTPVTVCAGRQPAGYVTNNTDCNDKDKAVNPNAKDVCDGVDNNCNGSTDEGNTVLDWYRDADADTYGANTVSFRGCIKDSTTFCLAGSNSCRARAGYVNRKGDCCDTDNRAKPGQTSYFTTANKCNSFDYNCDNSASPSRATCQCSKQTRYTRSGYADSLKSGSSWTRWYTQNSRTDTYQNGFSCELDLSTSLGPSSNTYKSCSADWCCRTIIFCVENCKCSRSCTLLASSARRSWAPRDGSKRFVMWRRSGFNSNCAYKLDGSAPKCGDTVYTSGSLVNIGSYKPSGISQTTSMSGCNRDSNRCNNTCQSRINYSFSMDNSTYGYTKRGSSYTLSCR